MLFYLRTSNLDMEESCGLELPQKVLFWLELCNAPCSRESAKVTYTSEEHSLVLVFFFFFFSRTHLFIYTSISIITFLIHLFTLYAVPVTKN